MTRREYHEVQGAYPSDRPSRPEPFLEFLRDNLCKRCGGVGWHVAACPLAPLPQHGPAVASWPGYTPQAQAYDLATRGPALDDGLPHEYGEPCECEGCQWPDYDAKVDA